MNERAVMKDEGRPRLRDDSPATKAQCDALKSRGIRATPNTHTVAKASALLDQHREKPSPKQIRFAKSLGIDVAGMSRSTISDAIDDALKAKGK